MPRSLSGYPYRTLFAWVATLALCWVALCSPWSAGWNWTCAALIVFLVFVATALATRRAHVRREATRHVLSAIDSAIDALPADVRRNTPLVITVSDASKEMLPGDTPKKVSSGDTSDADAYADVNASATHLVHVTETAIWVRLDEPARLAHLADALKRWRDGQGPDAVVYLIAADDADNRASFGAGLRRWRSAIGEASRALGYPLPVCVAIYMEETHHAPDECPWFGISSGAPLDIDALPALLASRIAPYTRMAIPMSREPRAHRSARLGALTRWACDTVLPALVDVRRGTHPLHVTAFGVTAVDGRPAPGSLYGQYITQATGLTLHGTAGSARLACPLPEPLLRGIAPQPVRHASPRALAHAFACLAVCFCAAAAASAWQNRLLVERVAGDVARYRAVPATSDAARVDALAAVKRDRDELEQYARSGVPPRLGLGLYRGAPLLPEVRALIASYEPPPVPPSAIELSSLSLFQTGSAMLNPGSNRVLVGALEMISAHPDKRVLIAGHTDSVGRPDSNLKLSEARAASVRDWLADASDIPASHFAIQGYGDTRPKTSNHTGAGREANRRVEITLVPDCRDTHGDSSNRSPPQGHPACLQKE
jgi:outer membrane protein OmpA-like peptidoglycan-associated protein